MLQDSPVTPIALAALTHFLCHHRPPASLSALIGLVTAPPLALYLSTSSIPSFLRAIAVYLPTLAASIALYRISPFHPLAKVPGPPLARLSRFWATRAALSDRQYVLSHELFARYGDVVRTGPDHLIVRDVRAVNVVLGPRNPWPRHQRYAIFTSDDTSGNVLGLVDPAVHKQRRKIWDRAFTPNAVRSYQPMLDARVAQFLDALASRTKVPLDLAAWFGYFSTDFMGDFAYGGAFDLMVSGTDEAKLHETGLGMLHSMEVMGTIPWLRPLIAKLVQYGPPIEFFELANRVVAKRTQEGSSVRDLFYYLLNEDGEGSHPPLSILTLGAEAGLAMLAGSDTTSTALANAVFYLNIHPECLVRLRAELETAGTDPDLGEMRYLQAVINETLRLQPAMPNGVQRVAPHGGGPVDVADQVVPPGTAVQIPTWSLHRDPRYFSPDPEAFLPERWLPEEGPKLAAARSQEYALNQGAYMPFNYGPTNCVGRALALHEMRTVLAVFVRRFDVRFEPGFQAQDWLDQLHDKGILARGRLDVVLSSRTRP